MCYSAGSFPALLQRAFFSSHYKEAKSQPDISSPLGHKASSQHWVASLMSNTVTSRCSSLGYLGVAWGGGNASIGSLELMEKMSLYGVVETSPGVGGSTRSHRVGKHQCSPERTSTGFTVPFKRHLVSQQQLSSMFLGITNHLNVSFSQLSQTKP